MRTTATRRLLLVEDNPGDADLIADLIALRTPQHRVTHVSTIAAATNALLADLATDAVLLDLGLPDGHGAECVTRLRGLGGGPAIVVLTGGPRDDVAMACLAAGASDFLAKDGLRADSLERAVAYAIARVREGRERSRADALHARLAAVVESSFDAILTLALDGTVTSWNSGAERTFGYSAAEAVGQPVPLVIVPSTRADAADQLQRVSDLGRDSDGTPLDAVRRRKDGQLITVSAVSSTLRDAAGRAVGVATICRDVTQQRQRDLALRARTDELIERDHQMRALTNRLNAVREDERTRISRTVHDELGQLLTGIMMDLRWVQRRLGDGITPASTLGTRLDEVGRLAAETIATVQRIAVELRPSALDALGLPAAIRDELRRFGASLDVAVRFDVVGASPPPAVATALFRILQELLTNVARHARARTVRVTLSEREDVWTLGVEDDGVGMAASTAPRRTTLGLLGISERAQALGGTASWAPGAGGGTSAIVRIPKGEDA